VNTKPHSETHPSRSPIGAPETIPGRPAKQGLYDPWFEHDSCGVGFVVDMHGRKSHDILQQGLQVLTNLDHRGASGAEINTGDGAGVLLQMPHKFLVEACKKARITLPEAGQYGSGIVFMPRNASVRRKLEEIFGQIVQSEGQTMLGWRTVPTNNSTLGETAKASEPVMRQIFIGRDPRADRRHGVRAQALHHPQARLHRDPHVDRQRRGIMVRGEPLAKDDRL
jgi:glutamate synthase domain-containing protein 1